MKYQEQVAVVTGAGGTLCSKIAEFLAQNGAKVVLIGRTREKLLPVAEAIQKNNGKAWIFTGDVTDEKTMQVVADQVSKQCGPCRWLINGAGGNSLNALTTTNSFDPQELKSNHPENMRGFFDLDLKTFESVLKNNTIGTVIPCQIFARQMASAGGGVILNFASMNTFRPLSRVPAYAMSKAAISNFTQWLAAYLAPAHIRVNAIAPGFFVNERSIKYLCTPNGGLSARGENVMAHTPLKRFGQAEELIGCVEWLLNDDKAGFVTGTTIPIDGGFLASSGV